MEINLTILGQAITFAILVWFTMKFVWPPLNNMLEERAKKIADGLDAAEKGRQSLRDAELRVSQELHETHKQISEIMTKAGKRADQIIEEAKHTAHLEAEKILEEARREATQELLNAREELREKISFLVVKGVEQILKEEVDIKRHQKLISNLEMEVANG